MPPWHGLTVYSANIQHVMETAVSATILSFAGLLDGLVPRAFRVQCFQLSQSVLSPRLLGVPEPFSLVPPRIECQPVEVSSGQCF